MTDADELRGIAGCLAALGLRYNQKQIRRSQYERERIGLLARQQQVLARRPAPVETWKPPVSTGVLAGVSSSGLVLDSLVEETFTSGSGEVVVRQGVYRFRWTDKADPAPWQGEYTPFPSVADTLWEEHHGTILCECDNPDCDRVIQIDRVDYRRACGAEGWFRVTHPGCGWGVLNARLISRTEHYHVYATGI